MKNGRRRQKMGGGGRKWVMEAENGRWRQKTASGCWWRLVEARKLPRAVRHLLSVVVLVKVYKRKEREKIRLTKKFTQLEVMDARWQQPPVTGERGILTGQCSRQSHVIPLVLVQVFFFFLANFILVDYSDSEDNYIQQRRGCDRTHFQVPPTPHSRFQSLLAVFSHFLPLPIFCFRLPFVIPYHPCFGAPHTPFSSLPKPVLISQTPVFS